MVYKYREVRGTFTALTPDTTDADEHPNLVPLNGSVILTPVFKNGGISFAEEGHFDQPQVKRAAIEDGELKAVVVDDNTGHLTRQALFLPVTDDDRADQQWSYEATFPEVVRTDTGERVVIPARRFVVEAGAGPLNLAAVATAQTAGAIVTRGPRGYAVEEVTAANAELLFQWEDGHTTSIPMPEAVPGVGVAEATQPYEGGLAFDLTDGTSTSSVSLPAGPPGRDGANVLPGRTTVLSEAWQPDLLEVARERSPYRRMTVTQNADRTTTVTCHADDQGGHTLAYTLTTDERYRIIGEIREGGGDRAVTYSPALDDSGEYAADRMLLDATLSGTWNTSSTYFTEQVGAYWEVEITTTSPGDTIAMTARRDDRGGLWRVELVEDSSVSATVSTYKATAETARGIRLVSAPTPGTYTVRGTFMGADPNNPPNGNARGWLVSETWGGPLVRVSERIVGSAALSPNPSNKNWALRLAHPDAEGDQFFPYHGQDVETIAEPPRLYDGATPLTLAEGQTVEVESLTMVQHILCHDDDYPEEELIEVRTIDTIYPDGTYRATGRIEVLENLIAGVSTYFGMLPINPQELNAVVTPFRTAYPATPDMTGNTNIDAGEGRHSTSVAAVGDDPDVVAVARFNAPEETRRLSVNAMSTPMFLQHRDPGLAKIYPRLGYNAGTVVPAGTVWRFSVDYWLGRVPGIRHLIE